MVFIKARIFEHDFFIQIGGTKGVKSKAQILSYMNGEENSIYSALSLDKLHEIYQGTLDLKNLRIVLRNQMIDKWNYVPSSNNCLTFAF